MVRLHRPVLGGVGLGTTIAVVVGIAAFGAVVSGPDAGPGIQPSRVMPATVTKSPASPGSHGSPVVEPDRARSARLASKLLAAVQAQQFADLLDSEQPKGSKPARMSQPPNLDVTVIELTPGSVPRAVATVLMSPAYPNGRIVPLPLDQRGGLTGTDQVTWRQWDDAGWQRDGGRSGDVLVRAKAGTPAPLDFMSPYPASVLKLMVGFEILRMVDADVVGLGETYKYSPPPGTALCGGDRTATVTTLFDEMITASSNQATCALISLLHERDGVKDLSATFERLGLSMLQLKDTDPLTGGHWFPGVVMNSADTARLLLLLGGGPGMLWRAPDGSAVTRDELSPTSRAYFLGKLADQGLNQVLSTTNWCGRKYPAAGIPQRTPARWVDPATGTVTVGDRDYRQDVRPCDKAAEVTFAHKTGFVSTSGVDAGIVRSLPGKPARRYVVAVFSNLGSRYVDAGRPADRPGVYPVVYTEKLARLGRAIDQALTGLAR